MKKLLLSVALLGAILGANAQTILKENFNSYTVGDISSDLTGNTLGQGDWAVFGSAGTAATTDFQIGALAAGDNAIVFNGNGGPTAATGAPTTTRYIFKDISAGWGARTAGNDVVKMEVYFYTGDATASHNQINAALMDVNGHIAAGFRYMKQTNNLRGVFYLNTGTPATTGTYYVNLGTITGTTPAPLVLQDANWYVMLLTYNKTTGKISWYCNGATDIAVNAGISTTGYAAMDIAEYDFYINSGSSTNAASQTVMFDDLLVNAQADESLGTVNNKFANNALVVSPNPAKDFVNVTGDNTTITGITISDLNGRVVKSLSFDGVSSKQVNISDLSAGVYMMNISSNKGTATKKIIKN
jgi:hypothetical protein